MNQPLCLAVLASLSMTAAAALSSPLTADLIILNATVRTLDDDPRSAQALATCGNRIAAVGSNAEVRCLAGPNTRILDAQGQLVLPGFNDAHLHFLSGGFQLASVDLREARTPAEFAQRLGRFAAGWPADRWVTGGDWDHELWPGAPLPTRQMIDAVTGPIPVFVNRLDGHMALANTVALERAGISRATPDPPGGLIVRDPETGDPTGILKDAAMGLVSRLIPPPSRSEKLAAARAATDHAARFGVTSVQDMSTDDDLGVYQELDQRGELKTRIYAFRPLAQWEQLAALGVRAPFGNERLRLGGLKAFSDGSLGSTTAWFFAPYADAPDSCGLATGEMLAEERLRRRVEGADAAGLQVAIHAIGDRANHAVLTLFEQAAAANGPRDRRFRI